MDANATNVTETKVEQPPEGLQHELRAKVRTFLDSLGSTPREQDVMQTVAKHTLAALDGIARDLERDAAADGKRIRGDVVVSGALMLALWRHKQRMREEEQLAREQLAAEQQHRMPAAAAA